MEQGIITAVQRFSLHDGPGIRTTVFLKGCPLDCIWCHNPEAKSFAPQIYFHQANCSLCGRCAAVCPQSAHVLTADGHQVNRAACVLCGRCVEDCPAGALEITGRQVTAEGLLTELLPDKRYFTNSGGGVTLSGGEPLAQPEFALGLLSLLKTEGVEVCVETSGFAPPEILRKFIPLCGLFLFDYKVTAPAMHRELTKMDNTLILSNLQLLCESGARVRLRCPLIPGLNDGTAHLKAIAALSNRYSAIEAVEIMPYHDLGRAKAEGTGVDYPLCSRTAGTKQKQLWESLLHSFGCKKLLTIDEGGI